MLNKNVEVFMACEKEAHAADIVLFGAPFDSTTSYRPGTRFGSSAIRRESYGIECYSPYQDKDLEDTKVMDCGAVSYTHLCGEGMTSTKGKCRESVQ